MKTHIANLFTAIVICLLLLGCTKTDDITIGISMGPAHERWTKDISYLTQHLESQNAKVIVREANGSQVEQARQAKEMIEKEKLDVLIIVPVNSDAAGKLVDYAKSRDIHVIAYDRIIKNCDLDFYLSFDNVRIGEIQAEYLTKIKPRGSYALLGGDPGDNNSLLLRIGQMNVLQPLIIRGDIKIVIDENVEKWDDGIAYQIMKDYLTENDPPDAIIASSDGLSRGASKALLEFGVEDVLLSGQDAETDACRRIVEGHQTMTVYKVIESLAASAANMAILLANNEDVPNTLATVNNGIKMVPAVLVSSIIPVGIENIRMTVIQDGFIDEKEVFVGKKPN
jgi:D-xylose transport system substrate-binding protein